MKKVIPTFLKGLFTVLPLLLSVYVLAWFLRAVEAFSRDLLLSFWPAFLYAPGLGAVLAFAVIFGIGSVVDRPFARTVFNLIEGLLTEIPVVKTVYLAIKDFTEYLKPDENRKHNQVVLVRFPTIAIEIVGLMTRESLADLPAAVTKEGRVAVYIPMSYQFGGCTMFIPRDWVTPTDLSVEEAMRSIITAWLPGQAKKLEQM